MNIYFAGSIRGGRQDAELYQQLIQYLGKYGKVLTEHVGDPTLVVEGEDISDREIYARDLNWLKQCQVLVAEITTPSFGVGYEVATAEHLDLRILLLYRAQFAKQPSAMASGNPRTPVRTYRDIVQAYQHVDDFFQGGPSETDF